MPCDGEPKFCGCGRRIFTLYDQCGKCRKGKQQQTCTGCEDGVARAGNLLCVGCINAADAEGTAVRGWIRPRPGGPLVGDHSPHNHETNCTAHDVCSKKSEAA